MTKIKQKTIRLASAVAVLTTVGLLAFQNDWLDASSHREAPLIANDALADNTDVYAFRSPDDTNTVTLIANYGPFELPQGGPNYYSFGTNVRYEIHVNNGADLTQDQIVYRFTFQQVNEDPTTFFNIRLGKQNLKTTYTAQRSMDGGSTFTTIVTDGIVPPNNIGPRSIEGPVGLNTPYETLRDNAITTATTGETIFCGPSDDPFFVDLGGIFDLGQTRAGGTGVDAPKDGLKCKNVHSICIKVPISTLQKDGKDVSQAVNILDPDFVIGVWASASRRKIRTIVGDGTETHTGNFVQISRLGMPLSNEAIIPIGQKDYWNSLTPYQENGAFDSLFTNPELALYMDTNFFAAAVPALSMLRIQHASPTILGNVDFGNTQDGLFVLYGHPATTGTALDTALFGNYLLRNNQPRSVDLLPIFHTGVPNLAPYQLAVGKPAGNPLAAGKPFIHNFLPVFGDMLRLNMAVPVTPRNDPNFSSEGLIAAAVLGLTNSAYNTSPALQFIPNMDGFPNGRRLEDDITRIELQAVGGVVLAAIGLFYDDYTIGGNPVTPQLLNVLTYTTGIETNDTTFKSDFPYVQTPWSGYGLCTGGFVITAINSPGGLNIGAPQLLMETFPNPANAINTIRYRVTERTKVLIRIYDGNSKIIATPVNNEVKEKGTYEVRVNLSNYGSGNYYAVLANNNQTVQSIKIAVAK